MKCTAPHENDVTDMARRRVPTRRRVARGASRAGNARGHGGPHRPLGHSRPLSEDPLQAI
jgi:hypothetical protein